VDFQAYLLVDRSIACVLGSVFAARKLSIALQHVEATYTCMHTLVTAKSQDISLESGDVHLSGQYER